MKRTRSRLINVTLIVIGFLLILLLVVFPLVARQLSIAGWLSDDWAKLLRPIEIAQTLLMQIFVIAWFTFFGSCFASFLNVVAWRVPRGRTINGSSHCPNCDAKLSMTDNIPIFGWLSNGGKCSYCNAPISIRYLLVELILGLVTLMVVSTAIFGAGWNLPGMEQQPFRIIHNSMADPNPLWFWFTAFHLTLIYLLFTFAVIRHERLWIPMSIFITGILFGIGFHLIEPALAPLSYAGEVLTGENSVPRGSTTQWLTIGIGLISGILVGFAGSKIGWFWPADSMTANEKEGLFEKIQNQKQAVGNQEEESAAGEVSPDEVLRETDSFAAASTPPIAIESEQVDLESVEQAQGKTEEGDRPEDDAASSEEVIATSPTVDPAADENTEQTPQFVLYPEVLRVNEGAAVFGLIGLFLGWQFVVVCAIISFVIFPLRGAWWETISVQLLIAVIGLVIGYRWVIELMPF
ncbi:MAG: prepilin peptidase [Planctomycetota bacterium]